MTNLASAQPVEDISTNYRDLKHYYSNLNNLFSIRSMLMIDMMTAMPLGGLQRRLNDIASVTKRIYAETTTSAVTKLLDAVENEAANSSDWTDWDKANLTEMRRIHDNLGVLPPELYLSSVRMANIGRRQYAHARKEQNWDEAQQHLNDAITLQQKIARLKQEKFGTDTEYEALCLRYGNEISLKEMDSLFDSLLGPLSTLKEKALEKQNTKDSPLALDGEFSRKDQMWLNQTILELIGFDFSRGTLMITNLNPMTAGTSDDVRILVRCSAGDSFLDSLEDTLYQGARGIYLQNLPQEWKMQPVGQAHGRLLLNAISLLYETIIGRTPQFFHFVSVRAEGIFRSLRNKSFEAENLYQLKKIINLTPRRDDADELTKIFHDMMRYRIEKDLISGDLKIKDLPDRWNADSKELLGVEPDNILDGPLQNPDWFTGRFGFIPTNTLSHMIAAQLHDKLFEILPDMRQTIQKGDMAAITNWVHEHIFSKGRSQSALDIVQSVTGENLSEKNLLNHLERRYLSDKR